MKKTYFYLIALGFAVGAVAYLVFFQPEKKVPELLDRNITISGTAEWLNTKSAIEGLIFKIRKEPNNLKAKIALAQAYIQEARETGRYDYYNAAAFTLLEQVLKKEPKNFEALCSKATVLLSQHHFFEAMQIAETAVKINPYNAFVYGILCDAYLELGEYEKAIEMGDKMVSVRPDIRSYSRIAYLREVMGDHLGAIEAMKLAVSAGYPGLEQTAWARFQLGKLYEDMGDLANAEMQYSIALEERPTYAYAAAGLGSIAKAKKDYKEAIKLYENAAGFIEDYYFRDELIDIYRLNNQNVTALKTAREVVKELSGMSDVDESVPGHGHYADLELAEAYFKLRDYNDALKHALIEYERRPKNIDVNQVLAWAYYKTNNLAKAKEHIEIALRTGYKNSTLQFRAGVIYHALKDNKGKEMMNAAIARNPYLSPNLLKESLIELLAEN